ncbi:hypothetical protein [Legionella resiliens]|uniref:Uncharacterized protein n=1 Tax=Legionella resiliens TaxID=2905958 RepID=A0ABS8X8J8_9GAMM|nr:MULTISPECIES: hypothetical protein [unclassified Legionella]MCE0724298.1 hypothetical protein [Legionella sp. 9fVS26]MCE3533450.1 hypothetical protein [Legionella sp. 8cVS16]
MSKEKVISIREFGKELNQCGSHWGKNVDLSGAGPIKVYTGEESWMESAIDGVIGLHGNEPGNGPAVIIKDIKHAGVDLLWTSGLIGCMALAILGTDAESKQDVFFCHARKYDAKNAIKTPGHPMKLARDFVQSHNEIRVFWGTDFNFGVKDFSGPHKKNEAQKLLSRELGCWVRNIDCVIAKELVFFPKLGIVKDGSPREAYRWIRSEDITLRTRFSSSMALSPFIPNRDLLRKLETHLAELKNDRSSWFRFYLYDSRRSNKIRALNQILDAYRVGNLDILRHFAQNANNKTSPFLDPNAVNTWSPKNKSITAKLALATFYDAKDKILEMGASGCGLRSDGSSISSHHEYRQRLELIADRIIGLDE